ncbi:MAG TPA: lysylphosphatidylglycerol synthase transmembrane domain-containing protein [Candidatus Saccharibacteria bacterium]|nr:lysylphosphatidylglycerol synthase transmembrane domain-containing protein [Candidatus Saccharibacteria bacterium]
MSFRKWLNIATIALIVLVVFFARKDILEAWHLLWQVDIWIFLLIIPVQFLSYYASGATIFSYLKHGGDLAHIRWYEQPKMALELNFVNHIFPTAGLSGASYMTYRLGKLGVNHGRATLAQVVKFAMAFLSYLALLIVAVIMVTVDGDLTRMTILAACSLVTIILLGMIIAMHILGNKRSLEKFSNFIDRLLNQRLRKLLKRTAPLIERATIVTFFDDISADYEVLRKNPKYLREPFIWGLVFNLAETAMFFVAFWALGVLVNPAPILIALGLAGVIGAVTVTPGGAGGYEAMMILFLTSAGVPASVAVAGVVLARTSLIILTISTGYVFYHLSMKKYGKLDT